MVGLNLQCSHPVETKCSIHTTTKEMLSTQYKQKFTWLENIVCVWMDLTLTLPSPNFGVVDTVNQEQ